MTDPNCPFCTAYEERLLNIVHDTKNVWLVPDFGKPGVILAIPKQCGPRAPLDFNFLAEVDDLVNKLELDGVHIGLRYDNLDPQLRTVACHYHMALVDFDAMERYAESRLGVTVERTGYWTIYQQLAQATSTLLKAQWNHPASTT